MKLMTDRSTHGRIILGVAALSFLPSVGAASATCVAGWEWSYNSKGSSPCEIAGSLQAPCFGLGGYVLAPLGEGSNYRTPQQNNTQQKNCECNTVIYSLYIACSICQKDPTPTPLPWRAWSQYCDSVYVSQYPLAIPFNASVPFWAYMDWTTDSFDATLAKVVGRDPEAIHRDPPVISMSLSPTDKTVPGTGTFPAHSSTSTGSSGGGGNNSGGSKTNVGAIAGGVVGGVVGLAGFAGLAFFFLRGRRGRQDFNATLVPNPLAFNPGVTQANSYSGWQTANPFQPVRYQGTPRL